jgi:hypothetical protein
MGNNSSIATDPNKKNYFKSIVTDEFEQVYLKNLTKLSSAHLTVWEKGENENKAESFKLLDFVSNPCIIKLSPLGKLATNIKGSSKSNKIVLIKFPELENVNYFGTGTLRFNENDLTYSIELSAEIFKSQRRVNARLKASDVVQIQYKIQDEVKNCYDLSAGGVSFIIEADALSHYPKHKMFENCTLRYDRKNYNITKSQIVGHVPLENDKTKIKIGIQFIDLIPRIREELDIKINADIHGDFLRQQFEKNFQEPVVEE